MKQRICTCPKRGRKGGKRKRARREGERREREGWERGGGRKEGEKREKGGREEGGEEEGERGKRGGKRGGRRERGKRERGVREKGGREEGGEEEGERGKGVGKEGEGGREAGVKRNAVKAGMERCTHNVIQLSEVTQCKSQTCMSVLLQGFLLVPSFYRNESVIKPGSERVGGAVHVRSTGWARWALSIVSDHYST